MATCKECLHYGVCTFHITENENEKCPHFKDKSQYAEVRHGKNVADYPSSAFECSLCGWSDWDLLTGDGVYNFCPNCGAKMDGGKDGES